MSVRSLYAVEPMLCAAELGNIYSGADIGRFIAVRGRSAESHAHSLFSTSMTPKASAGMVAGSIQVSLSLFPWLPTEDGEAIQVEGYTLTGSGIEVLDTFLEQVRTQPSWTRGRIIEALGILMMMANQEGEEGAQLLVGDFLIQEIFPEVKRSGKNIKSTLAALEHASRGTRIHPLLVASFTDFLISYLDHPSYKGLAFKTLKQMGAVTDQQMIVRLYDLLERSPAAIAPPEGRVHRQIRRATNAVLAGISTLAPIPPFLLKGPPPEDIAIIRLWEMREASSSHVTQALRDVADSSRASEETRAEALRVLSAIARNN